jgi:IS4 transposase
LPQARAAFPWPLRRIRFFDPDAGQKLVFLTNHLEVLAETVAAFYKNCWQIELFFRWIKQHPRIKHFFGTSPYAVKTQVWIAVTMYVLIATLHKELKLPGSLHRTMQIFERSPF